MLKFSPSCKSQHVVSTLIVFFAVDTQCRQVGSGKVKILEERERERDRERDRDR